MRRFASPRRRPWRPAGLLAGACLAVMTIVHPSLHAEIPPMPEHPKLMVQLGHTLYVHAGR